MVSPEKVFRVGAVQASVFNNQIEKAGKTINVPKVLVQLRYKDQKNNQWAGTNSFGLNEIPKLILALEEAYKFLAIKSELIQETEPHI